MEPLVEISVGSIVYRFMRALHRHDGRRTLALFHAARLTTPQLAVLEFLAVPRTMSAVSDHLGLSKSATSQLVDRLARQGLLQRSENAEDRRERHVALSDKGTDLAAQVTAARVARFNAALSTLPPDLAARFAAVLGEVNAALDSQPRDHAARSAEGSPK